MQKTRRYKGWDGKIRLYSPANGEIYCGLYDYLTGLGEEKGVRLCFRRKMNTLDIPKDVNDLITPEAVAGFVQVFTS